MIDFHTHILPGIDDGSPDLTSSGAMLTLLREQGATTILATPHYYPYEKTVEQFASDRQNALQAFRSAAPEADVRPAAEVYLASYLFNNTDLTPLCLPGTRTMLLELPYEEQLRTETVDRIWRLTGDFGLGIVLAHIDRYPFFTDPAALNACLEAGCTAQVNIYSFGDRHKRKYLRKYADQGILSALGSDLHRPVLPDGYAEGMTFLRKKLGEEFLTQIESASQALLDGKFTF